MDQESTRPKSEAVSKDTAARTEYSFYDQDNNPVHLSRILFKNRQQINIFPFTFSESVGVRAKRVSEIEFRGWSNYDDLPKLFKPRDKVSLNDKRIAPLMRFLYNRFKKFRKLIIIKNGGISRFSETTITFRYNDLEKICKSVKREISNFEIRRKTEIQNELSGISNQFSPHYDRLTRGALARYLSHFDQDINLSEADIDAVLKLIADVPLGNVTITENFIQTKNRINRAYLEKIVAMYEELMNHKGDNEKDWQAFFQDHGWILAGLFPYQVILSDREAYVGGKTIENKEGRVVDFLFQNGFYDNYALLEVKTHNKKLVRSRAYREPDAFSVHENCAAAIAQCLDQKNTFLREMGQKYSILDPKVVLVIGNKSKLNENQARAFELLRSNQKNIDIVTFDELLNKIYGLSSILDKTYE